MVDRTYDKVLPWGHWMRVKPGVLDTILIDEDGREWPSLRDALFHGRLRFKAVSAAFRDVELERMLAYLLAGSGLAGAASTESMRIDMFQDSDFRFFYPHWLVAEGLISGDARAPVFETKITEEGYSIAKMLLATRPPELAMFHPGVESVLYAQGRGEEIDRPAFERGDQNLSGLEYAFVRERIGSAAAISLVHRDLNERMPLVRTIWVQTFADERSRDGCFEWLSRRLDRWNVWGEVAYRTGAGALTQRLFSLLMFQMTEEPAAAGSERSTATGRSDDAAPPLLSIEYRRY